MEEYKGLPIRGLHIDMKVMTMKCDVICEIARDAARWGYNTILIEYQDKFPFDGELETIAAPDALTKQEVHNFISVCRELGLQVIPLVQCLGHSYYILMHEKFSHLGEEKGDYENMHALCPSIPESLDLYSKMIEQILNIHTECEYFHIGGDETRLSPKCPRCSGKDKADLLSDYYIKAAKLVRKRGSMPIIWGDMLLTYPEKLLPKLRGQVIVMDWDYRSTGLVSQKTRVWGEDVNNPNQWSDSFKHLVRPYVYKVEPYITNPFPYLKFLRDQGYLVIAAPAASCNLDPGFVPRSMHVLNCLQSVYSAAEANALGVLITNWSVRRIPWHLTEYSLIAAGMAMKNPAVSMDEINSIFCMEHFGVADRDLSSIPAILADTAEKASKTMDLFTMGLVYPDMDIGKADDYQTRQRVKKQTWLDNKDTAIYFGELRAAAETAKRLLGKADPKTEKQAFRTKMWHWAADWASFLAEYGPVVAQDTINPEQINYFKKRLSDMRKKDQKVLSPLLTGHAMESDNKARIDIHLQYLEKLRIGTCGSN